MKVWLIEKDPDTEQDSKHKEKGLAEDELVGWHHWFMDMNLSKLQEIVEARGDWCASVHEVAKNLPRPSNWTTTTDGFAASEFGMWALEEAKLKTFG